MLSTLKRSRKGPVGAVVQVPREWWDMGPPKAPHNNKRCNTFLIDTHPEIYKLIDFDAPNPNNVDYKKLRTMEDQFVPLICQGHVDKGCPPHRYLAKVINLVSTIYGRCPFCAGRKRCPCNNALNYLGPTHIVIREWSTKNSHPPEHYGPFSKIKVIFECSKPDICECHIWEATPCDRVNMGNGCPFCSGLRACKHRNFKLWALEHRPKLLDEWDYELNDVQPEDILPRSAKKRWWSCVDHLTCTMHRWRVSPMCRVNGNSGCPFCVKGRPCPCRNFKVAYPEYAAFFAYESNKGWPEDYPPNSGLPLVFNCPHGPMPHTWTTTPESIGRGSKCDTCNDRLSTGARAIANYLHHRFSDAVEIEKRFSDLRDKIPLPLDFFVPKSCIGKFSTVIEFDGLQHFRDAGYRNIRLDDIRPHDKIKNLYARSHQLHLLRISASEFRRIPSILDAFFARVETSDIHLLELVGKEYDDEYIRTAF